MSGLSAFSAGLILQIAAWPEDARAGFVEQALNTVATTAIVASVILGRLGFGSALVNANQESPTSVSETLPARTTRLVDKTLSSRDRNTPLPPPRASRSSKCYRPLVLLTYRLLRSCTSALLHIPVRPVNQ